MTPPCYTFAAAELPDRVQLDVHGRQRKPATDNGRNSNSHVVPVDGGRPYGVNLARDCTLLTTMLQYSCVVAQPHVRDSPVRCWPVPRTFRRCQDRTGSFTVETTAWEGREPAGASTATATDSADHLFS